MIDEKELLVDDIETTETPAEPVDDLDESLQVIEEEKEKEDAEYDADDNYIGNDPEVTDPTDWATPETDWGMPEFTPEGSDIPVSVDLQMLGENMIEEGECILDLIGPSGNEEFDKLVLDKDKSTVSYPDPQDPSHIIQEDADKEEYDGLGFEDDYLEDRVYKDAEEADADVLKDDEATSEEEVELSDDTEVELSEDDLEL